MRLPATATVPELPAFGTVLKSRDVEDPVNLWLHRPLAYALVALIYRTRITPNQITALALAVGLAAAACLAIGTPVLLLWSGALLWTSAILDGADGILARARKQFSELGRALDGTADLIVAASVAIAAVYHLWFIGSAALLLALTPLTVLSCLLHIYGYDYYKESYLHMTNPSWGGHPECVADVDERSARAKRHGSFAEWISSRLHADLLRTQTRLVALVDPNGTREGLRFQVSPESAARYRELNRGPMQLWALISLAPHTYLLAIAIMVDRIDLYIWARLLLGNALFAIALVWQRRASLRTREALAALGLQPLPA